MTKSVDYGGDLRVCVALLRLSAVGRGSHTEIVAAARDALTSSGASILDFHMFSNAILALNFEISPPRLTALRAALDQTTLRLDAGSRAALEQAVSDASTDEASDPLQASLSINVINDEPPLRIEVPAVPG